jgi:hypothetical protein
MNTQNPPPSREEILDRIANATLFGHLGLFVGTGFSKALTKGFAPSFEQLLQQVAIGLGLPFNFDDINTVRGASYPQIAARLVDLLMQIYSITFPTRALAHKMLKQEVARRCNIQPDPNLWHAYSQVLTGIKPSWIITTNYDFILEHLIEDAVPLLPNELVNSRRDFVPIYHIHGHRLVPDSIIITEDDYVELLGPTEYRQLKLSLLLAESTTLMLGYSLGDINVRAAMKLSRSIPMNGGFTLQPYQGLVIQALYTPGRMPRPDPFYGPNSEIIIEVGDILILLQEILGRINIWNQFFSSHQQAFVNATTDPQLSSKLATDENLRRSFIQALKVVPRAYQARRVVQLLHNALEPTWNLARQHGNWEYYTVFMNLILDIFSNIDARQMHPILFEYLAYRLAEISNYIDPSDTQVRYGMAWSATQLWRKRKNEIPTPTISMLKAHARNNQYTALDQLL